MPLGILSVLPQWLVSSRVYEDKIQVCFFRKNWCLILPPALVRLQTVLHSLGNNVSPNFNLPARACDSFCHRWCIQGSYLKRLLVLWPWLQRMAQCVLYRRSRSVLPDGATILLRTAVCTHFVFDWICIWLVFVTVDSSCFVKHWVCFTNGHRRLLLMPGGQCKLNAPARAVHTGASMFTCALVTCIFYPTILTAMQRVCVQFKCK